MIRFVAVGSLRGAFKRKRVLRGENQAAAIESFELERLGPGEFVVWRNGEPRIAPAGYVPTRTEKTPRVSALLRKQLIGSPCELVDLVKQSKKRREVR